MTASSDIIDPAGLLLFIFVFFCIPAVLFVLFFYWKIRRRILQSPDNDEYLARLTSFMVAVPFMEDDNKCYAISYKERRVVLRYSHRTTPKILCISFAVTQKFWLRLIPQINYELPDELHVGDTWLDGKLRIHSDEHDAALKFLNSPIIGKELRGIHPFDQFEIHRGNAIYTLHNPKDTGFQSMTFAQTLNHINQILEIYERQELDLFISVLHTESSVCPYCRSDFDPNKEIIATCNLCKTRHHETCLQENKQCTTWGCRATENDFSYSVIEPPRGNISEFEIN